MSNYSYSEIQNMQKKALERVREMRKNSEKLIEETDSTPYIKPKQFFEEQNQQIKPKITNMPPNFPQERVYPDFKEFFQREEKKQEKAKPVKTTMMVAGSLINTYGIWAFARPYILKDVVPTIQAPSEIAE